jgi:hypothetical protein
MRKRLAGPSYACTTKPATLAHLACNLDVSVMTKDIRSTAGTYECHRITANNPEAWQPSSTECGLE